MQRSEVAERGLIPAERRRLVAAASELGRERVAEIDAVTQIPVVTDEQDVIGQLELAFGA